MLLPSIKSYCDQATKGFDAISEEREATLLRLSAYFQAKYKANTIPKAIIICTHNSRRSHMGQVWLAVAAEYYGLPTIETYSGGTEGTAFNPRAVAALQRAGVAIQTNTENTQSATNPVYELRWNDTMSPYQAFSKRYDDAVNPKQGFAAIMVCSDADENCPVVFGMDVRVATPFDDPKAFDNTVLEAQKYEERSLHIATEFLFIMKNVEL